MTRVSSIGYPCWVEGIIDAQDRLRWEAAAMGVSWDRVWDELKRRGETLRTCPYGTYVDVVDALRRDIIAGRWPEVTL